jgi:hypothetical protein
MAAGQSPLEFMQRQSPAVAGAVETAMAKRLLAGDQIDLRGYAAADKAVHLINLSHGVGSGYRSLTVQYNPDGKFIMSESGPAAEMPRAATVHQIGSAPKRPTRQSRTSAAAASNPAVMATSAMMEMSLLPMRMSLAMMGAGGGAKVEASAEVRIGGESGMDAANVLAFKGARKSRGEAAGFVTHRYSEPVFTAQEADVVKAVSDWAERLPAGPRMRRRTEAAPAAPAPAPMR